MPRANEQALKALKRFGLGPKRGDIARIAADPRGFVVAQLDSPIPVVSGEIQSAAAGWTEFRNYVQRARDAKQRGQPTQISSERNSIMDGPVGELVPPARILKQESYARIAHALSSEVPFVERLVAFWSNHFCIST